MYTINTSTLLGAWQSLWSLVWGALRLDPAAFQAIQGSQGGGWLALAVLLMGGFSQALGQSIALLVNRVSRRQFYASLLVTGMVIALGIILWVSTIWLSATLVFRVQFPYIDILRSVSLGYAPFLFGIFLLLPYAGSFIVHVLDVWAFLAVLVAMNATLGLRLWQSLLCTLIGWLFFAVLRYLLGTPLQALVDRFVSLLMGAPVSLRVLGLREIRTEKRTEPPKGART